MGVIELILVIAGSSGITGFITWVVTLQASKKKVNAEADSAVNRNRFDVVDFENKITERVVSRLESDNQKKDQKINELSETVEQMAVTIKLQDENIEALHKQVMDYKQTCDNCKFRIEKKTNETNSRR